MIKLIALCEKGCSGRGVKIRTLTPSEIDKASVDTAKQVGKDSTSIEYAAVRFREMAGMAIVAVTREGGYKSQEEILALPANAWEKLDPAKLAMPEGPFSYDALFTARDDNALTGIINRAHFLSKDELDAIEGKALDVSED